MLKIKKEHIKDLEKFGFEKADKYYGFVKYDDDFEIIVFKNNPNAKLGEITMRNKRYWFDTIFQDERIELFIQDLIKADMVEKVEV